MKQSRLIRWTTVVAAVACVGLMLGSVSAEKKDEKKKTRVADVHQLMEGLVAPNCKALGAALKAEKTNFKRISRYGALMNESGHVLMADGRCPDAVWAGACKVLRDSGAEIAAKAKAKAEDKEGAAAAFKTLTTKGCGACHKVHKK